jgi:hypothetical protein
VLQSDKLFQFFLCSLRGHRFEPRILLAETLPQNKPCEFCDVRSGAVADHFLTCSIFPVNSQSTIALIPSAPLRYVIGQEQRNQLSRFMFIKLYTFCPNTLYVMNMKSIYVYSLICDVSVDKVESGS